MTLKEFYKEVGGDYSEVLHRLPAEDMVRKFLLKFPEDPSYAQLKQALKDGALADAFRAAHTMKGIGSNLGLNALTTAAAVLTEQLRNAVELPDPALVTAVDNAYCTAIDRIRAIDRDGGVRG